MTFRTVAGVMLAVVVLGIPARAGAQPARDLYTRALARERALRSAERPPTLKQIRQTIAAYERLVHRYPSSGYSDNALWQAGNLALMAFQRSGESADRQVGTRLLKQLRAGYPASSLLPRVDEILAAFEAPRHAAPTPARAIAPPPVEPAATTGRAASAPEAPAAAEAVTIRGITRTALPDGVRVSIEMDGESLYRQERLDNPRRVFFDLKSAKPNASLQDATLKFGDDVVREIRLGRHPQNTTRVVMDMEGVESYSVFALYNPYRLVIDFRRAGTPPPAPMPLVPIPAVLPALESRSIVAGPALAPVPALNRRSATLRSSADDEKPAAAKTASSNTKASEKVKTEVTPLPARDAAPPALSAPSVPAANSNGQFSLARQLGLGISRIVLDPGHGGHDPGAHGNGVNEAELVLDVSLRLRKLLEKQPGVEVVMTRDTDVFIPLEERTARANREGADLFLSIHANASRNTKARGIETYFLNFASNPEAEAVAARENSASGKTMHSLPDIVRAIALNNKIDESRDFADMIQKSMVRRLAQRNDQLRDLGVKQAPFVVLIGAAMPSVLAEISFVTNRQEGQLLKTPTYRQQIAEALFDAVVRYQKALKAKSTIAAREE